MKERSKPVNQANPKYKDAIDWDYLRSVPIMDVAESLGIEVDRHGKALCPCHDDHNPSMIIGSKTNKSRENSWWCPVCHEGGSTLDLVLAKKYGVLPSAVRKNKELYSEEIKGAAHYINDLFPGGITQVALLTNNKGINEPAPPMIPWAIIKEVGLKHNPIFEKATDNVDLSKTDRAEILLDKLMLREKELWEYAINVVVNFPKLDAKANAAIFNQAKEWIAEIHPYTEAVRKYYFAISDFEYPDNDLDSLDEGLENDAVEVEYA